MIYSALLKYGYSNFKLEVLEYCDSEVLLSKEQEYLDIYCPEYNILKKAGSSLGFTHSAETIAKFKEISQNRIYSEERKAKFAALNQDRSKELQERRAQLLNLNISKGHPIEVINVSTNQKTFYPSIRQAASELDVAPISIRRVLISKKLLKGTYKISKKDASK